MISLVIFQKEDQLMIKSEMTATSSITRDELDLAIKRTKQQIIDKLTLSSNNSLSELETRMTRVSKKQVNPGFTNYQPQPSSKTEGRGKNRKSNENAIF